MQQRKAKANAKRIFDILRIRFLLYKNYFNYIIFVLFMQVITQKKSACFHNRILQRVFYVVGSLPLYLGSSLGRYDAFTKENAEVRS